MTASLHPVLSAAFVLNLAALSGCTGAYTVDLRRHLDRADLPPLEPPHSEVTYSETDNTLRMAKPGQIRIRPAAADRGAAAAYDGLLWWVLRIPCVVARGPDGERCFVMLDTGLDGAAAVVTADVAIRQELPARKREPLVAFVPRLDVAAGVSLRGFPATVHPTRWEARLLGLPIYRMSGYALGHTTIRCFSYVAFDNASRRVRFMPRQPFAPRRPERWDAYPLTVGPDGGLSADVPLSGQVVRLCPDTGGGPVPILSAADWRTLAPRVKVRRRRDGSYPSWNGFVPVDVYTLDELTVANQRVVNATVWVRRAGGPDAQLSSTVGMGSFRHTTAVYDFKNMKLWVKRR